MKSQQKNWAKKNGDWNSFSDDVEESRERVKKYLEIYGTYVTKELSIQMNKLCRVKNLLFASGGSVSFNEQIYLDSEEALLIVGKAKSDFETITKTIIKLYKEAIIEAQELWEEGLSQARHEGSLLDEWEIQDALTTMGFTQRTIVQNPCEKYQEKIDKIDLMTVEFNDLVIDIKRKVAEIVQRDSDLARQLKGV